MRVSIMWWELADSAQTISSLRGYLAAEGVPPWDGVPGLCLKFWIADPETDRWGAVTVWENAAAMRQPLPPSTATELIGYPPTQRAGFEVEAGVGDLSLLGQLLRSIA